MTRIEYTTGAKLRTEYPRLETVFGTLAYWLSLQFGEHGWVYLGGFEPPYDGQPGRDKTITINGVEYEGSIQVMLTRSGEMTLTFDSFHRVGEWRTGPTPAAQRKLESVLLPLAKELFPMPTREHYASEIYREAAATSYRGASNEIHSHSTKVFYDGRYAGYADDIKAGMKLGLERMASELDSMTFEVNSRY